MGVIVGFVCSGTVVIDAMNMLLILYSLGDDILFVQIENL